MNTVVNTLPITPPPALDTAAAAREEILLGLRGVPKRLSSRHFYDAHGSQLFEQICAQPEYYLTRCELAILQEQGADIAAALGSGVLLVEFGCGSAHKTMALLAAMHAAAGYVAVEISASALAQSTHRLQSKFADLHIESCCADFTHFDRADPGWPRHERRIVYFPGSTLGNFDPPDALDLLRRMRRLAGNQGAVLLGLDLRKDVTTIEAAYNDAAGITRAFTLNMLARFNRELEADFQLDAFAHRARYDRVAHRIDTHIISRCAQRVRIAGTTIPFVEGEAMLVERSYKYAIAPFSHFAAAAGLSLRRVWTDSHQAFAVLLLAAAPC